MHSTHSHPPKKTPQVCTTHPPNSFRIHIPTMVSHAGNWVSQLNSRLKSCPDAGLPLPAHVSVLRTSLSSLRHPPLVRTLAFVLQSSQIKPWLFLNCAAFR